MKKYSFLLLVMISVITVSAQQSFKLDSLWNIWQDTSNHNTVRFQALMDYPFTKFGWNQLDSLLFYANIAEKFARERNLQSQLAHVYQRKGGIQGMKGEFEKADTMFMQCLYIAKKINDKKKIGLAYYSMAINYTRQGNYKKSNEYYEKAIPIYEEHQTMDELTKIYRRAGTSYRDYGNYQLAVLYLKKALKIDKELEKSKNICNTLINIGWIYIYQEDNSSALTYFKQSLELANKIDFSSGIAGAFSSLGTAYRNEGKYDIAIDNYEKAISMYLELGKLNQMGPVYNNMSLVYQDLGDYDKSLEYLFKSLEAFKQSHDKRQMRISMVHNTIAEDYRLLNNLTLAIIYNDSAYKSAKAGGYVREERDVAKTFYQIYKKLGNEKDALYYHEQWWALSDSLKKDDTDKKLQQFEFERQRQADSLAVVQDKLRADLEFQETLSTEKQTRNTFMYAGLGILLIAGGLLSRMLYIRKTNQELENKNKSIAREKVKAEESEKAKEQFFNNVSHEFRTPLTLILGPLDEVLSKPINEDSRSDLQIMQRSALRLQGMINELLELSKLDFGSIRLQAKETNIVDATREYLQSFESLADQRKIRLSFKSDARKYNVWLDLEKYRKILANLLSNAFKFSEEGGAINIEIGIPAQSNIQNKVQAGVEIRITDTGIGIPPAKLPYIFDRFFQTGDKSFTLQAGTGIGLALTKELVELHHGTIAAESIQGEGTTFIIFIPFGSEHLSETEMDVEEKATAMDEKTKVAWALEEDISGFVDEEEIRKKGEKPIVLITEDNPDMLVYIKSHLEEKYKILKARDGEEGLATALEKIPDLIISDVMMPRMDGNEMTEKLKTDQRTSHIPVILLTARASVDNKIEGLETGADAYLTKPFNARELKVRVKNLIRQRRKLRELFGGELSTGVAVSSSTASLPSMDQKFIQMAIEIVNRQMAEPGFDVTLMASEMALSRSQLHRKIKALTDKTTSEFIRTIRLNKAADLLRQKADTVTQIAYETGFNNLSWFAKAFKEQFGVSPSEYTKSE